MNINLKKPIYVITVMFYEKSSPRVGKIKVDLRLHFEMEGNKNFILVLIDNKKQLTFHETSDFL